MSSVELIADGSHHSQVFDVWCVAVAVADGELPLAGIANLAQFAVGV